MSLIQDKRIFWMQQAQMKMKNMLFDFEQLINMIPTGDARTAVSDIQTKTMAAIQLLEAEVAAIESDK